MSLCLICQILHDELFFRSPVQCWPVSAVLDMAVCLTTCHHCPLSPGPGSGHNRHGERERGKHQCLLLRNRQNICSLSTSAQFWTVNGAHTMAGQSQLLSHIIIVMMTIMLQTLIWRSCLRRSPRRRCRTSWMRWRPTRTTSTCPPAPGQCTRLTRVLELV